MEPEFQAHLFICTNDRGPDGKRPSCAHRGAKELRDQVKAACREKGFAPGTVRINNAGCLDQCERGITAVLYPAGKWFLDLKPEDAPRLVQAVADEIKGG
ncbi:MAG: (2Fe-2S) ferredoxin domain-containing protein [Bdellovibrionota bacterium]